MPDRKQDRNAARPEFEVAYYTKELGQSLQRQMLKKQLARFSSASGGTGAEVAATETPQPQLPEDGAA